ncbi:helix-turn-helix domain-containing protein [Vagococcus fluvialis]|uniref:helix-turn-helix domain-containing protein n=1 Tax=Vagococcus fluvialis TaxID=2738 RepID=UPI003B596161
MNRLKKIRNENSLTLMNLSKKLDIPKSTLSRYENGTSEPKQETWEQIADFFDVSTGYLMGISNRRINDNTALEAAREVYFRHLNSKEIDPYELTALEYFNNENLDKTLLELMNQYFSIPVVVEVDEFSSLNSLGYLHDWLMSTLVERYQKEVKSNQNLIENVKNSISDTDVLYTYNKFKEVQMNLPSETVNSLVEMESKLKNTNSKINQDDTYTLIAYNYENSVNEDLKKELEEILTETTNKINLLKNKYPDQPSDIKQQTILISNSNENGSIKFWSRIGDKDFKDELNISEPIKQEVIELASALIKRQENIDN